MANKGVDPDIYTDNAMFSEMSKQQSTSAKIATQGGIAAAVATDVADASIKAKQQQSALVASVQEHLQTKEGGEHSKKTAEDLAKSILEGGTQAAEVMKNALASAGTLAFAQSSVKTGGDLATVGAYHNSGMVDEGGSLTTKAKEAMERKETTSGAEMLKKGAFMDEENKETLQAFNAKTINQLGRTAEEKKNVAQKMQNLGFLKNADDISFDKNGNAVASSITPTYGNQLAKAVGTAQGGKLGENLKAMIISDAEVKNAGKSVSAVKNNQYVENAGSAFNAGVKGEKVEKTIEGAGASEAAGIGMSPNEWVKGIAAMGHDKGVQALQGLGYDSDEAENLYNTITSPAVGVAGAIAIAEITSRVQGKGSPTKKVWDETVRVADNLKEKLGFSSPASRSEQPPHKSSNTDDSKPDSKVNNESNHGNSFNSDNHSMPNNSESVNSKKGGWGNFTGERFNAASEAMDHGGSWRTKLSLIAGATALGYGVDAEAREMSPSSPSPSTAVKTMPKEEEGFLKQTSDTLGNMEFAGGITTLAAEGASKFSSVAKSIASVGAKTMPAVGMAFGTADAAYRVNEGDNLGAAMSAGIAVASTVPVVGTGLAFAGTLAQIATDAMGVTGANKSAAPQHQGFATQPSGFHTMQAISAAQVQPTQQPTVEAMQNNTTVATQYFADQQQQATQAQISMANNIQALTAIAPNSATPVRSYVGFTMRDADQNSVSFTTDKTSRNVIMNGHDTGVQAQQFSSMMQNPDSVNQFANAISQTSLSNIEAYNATNSILSEMNTQNQRSMMQQKIHNNASDTNRTLQHKEILDANRQGKEEEHEF